MNTKTMESSIECHRSLIFDFLCYECDQDFCDLCLDESGLQGRAERGPLCRVCDQELAGVGLAGVRGQYRLDGLRLEKCKSKSASFSRPLRWRRY